MDNDSFIDVIVGRFRAIMEDVCPPPLHEHRPGKREKANIRKITGLDTLVDYAEGRVGRCLEKMKEGNSLTDLKIQGYPVLCKGIDKGRHIEKACKDCPLYTRLYIPMKPSWVVSGVDRCVLRKVFMRETPASEK